MVMAARVKALALLLLPPIVTNALRYLLRHGRAGSNTLIGARIEPIDSHRTQCEPRKYWGLCDLDREIEKYLQHSGGYYVELGANDGRFSSNTLYFEGNKDWRGVLVEAVPHLFLECRRNRSTRNHIVCAACVSFDYKDEFVKMIYSNSMSVPLNVESDIGDRAAHAELGRQFLRDGETLFTFGAKARTLDSILREAGSPWLIDFLSLDVEGAELEVLKGIDHHEFKFRYMLIECRDIARMQAYLEPLNYRLLERFQEHDYLFALDAPTPQQGGTT
jgi:FkbM family methyltransferase